MWRGWMLTTAARTEREPLPERGASRPGAPLARKHAGTTERFSRCVLTFVEAGGMLLLSGERTIPTGRAIMVVVEVRGLRRGTYRIAADNVRAAWDDPSHPESATE